MSTEDVTTHGAVGDGGTDDTQAIVDAANAAGAGGTVYFPSGTYLVGSNDRFPLEYPNDSSWDNLTWEGEDHDNTTIQMAGGQPNFHVLFYNPSGNYRVAGMTIKQIELDLNKQNQGSTGSHAIQFREFDGTLTMRDVVVRNTMNSAINAEDLMDQDIQYCSFYDNGVDGETFAHDINPVPSGVVTCTVKHCYFSGTIGGTWNIGNEEQQDWITATFEDCFVENSPRLIKVDPENDTTTIRRVHYRQGGVASSPIFSGVATNYDSASAGNCGDIYLDNVFVDGNLWPAIDIASGNDTFNAVDLLHVRDTRIKDVENNPQKTFGDREGVAFFAVNAADLDVDNISIYGVGANNDGDCLHFDSTVTGSVTNMTWGDAARLGTTNSVSVSATQGGAEVSPTLPAKTDVGARAPSGATASLAADISAGATLSGTLTVTQQAGTVDISNNWFFDEDDPTDDPTGAQGDAVWIEGDHDVWSDVNATLSGNHYHPLEPDSTIGSPRTGLEPDWFDDILPSQLEEGFESGSPSDLSGDTGSVEYQTSTVLDGTQSARTTAAGAVWVSDADGTTVRDVWYSAQLQWPSGVDACGILFNISDGFSTGAGDLVGYAASISDSLGQLELERLQGSDRPILTKTDIDPTDYQDTPLRVAWTMTSGGEIRVRWYTADGSGGWTFEEELSWEDDAYTSGQWGFEASGSGVVVDAFTEYSTPLPTVPIPDETRRVPPTGWYVEVDHPDRTQPLTPTVVDSETVSPTPRPTLNGLPECDIPVPAAEKWLDESFRDAPMRVWQDGERVPVERLVDRDISKSQGIVTLTAGVGGDLRQTLDPAEYADATEADVFVRDLLNEHTDLAHEIDDPKSVLTSDIPLVELSSQTETTWDEVLPAAPFADTEPMEISDQDFLQNLEIGVFEQGTSSTRESNSPGKLFHDAFVNGVAAEFQALGEQREYELTLDYDMGDPHLYVRFSKSASSSGPGVTVYVDGQAASPGGGTTEINYQVLDDSKYLFDKAAYLDFPLSGILEEGTHEVLIETTTGSNDESLYVDALGFVDETYHAPDGDVLTEPGGRIEGQHNYPDWPVETRDYGAAQQIVAGELNSFWYGTGGNQSVAISNDDGANWIVESNSDTVSGEFSSGSNSMRGRLTLSSYDGGGGIAEFDHGQSVGQLTLLATLDSSPILVEQKFGGTVAEALTDVADYGNFIWEVRWDRLASGLSVEMTQPGQRLASGDPSVLDYSVQIDGRSVNKKAIVRGAATDEEGEQITADIGTAVSLPHEDLVTGETVVESTDGTEYVSGSDYSVDPVAGAITALSGGAITDGETLVVDYAHKVRGSYALPSFDGDPEEIETVDIPEITTVQAATNAALTIVKETSTPLQRAEVQIETKPAGWQLVEMVSFVDLPDRVEAMEIYSLEQSDGVITLQLGNRDEVSAVVSRIKQRLAGVSSRV